MQRAGGKRCSKADLGVGERWDGKEGLPDFVCALRQLRQDADGVVG